MTIPATMRCRLCAKEVALSLHRNGPHLGAYCDECGGWITWVKQSEEWVAAYDKQRADEEAAAKYNREQAGVIELPGPHTYTVLEFMAGLGDTDTVMCDDCEAWAYGRDGNEVEHHPTCVPGDAERWARLEGEANANNEQEAIKDDH